jgi:hypothetical protein
VTGGGDPAVPAVAWTKQHLWSTTASQLKTRLTAARAVALLLTIAGAVLATAAGQLPSGNSAVGAGLAVAAAIAVGLAPLALRLADSKAVQTWTRARGISEALKTEIYTYLAGVGPYRGAGGEQQLAERVGALSENATDLLRYTARVQSVSKELPAVCDVSSYIEHRVRPQISWYREKAKSLATRLTVVKGMGFALSVLAVVLGAVSLEAGVGGATAWLPVTATVAAAVTAYAAWARYEYQVTAYLRTAESLESLLTHRDALGGADTAADDDFVAHCERIVSDENKDWVTEWARPQSGS